MIEMLEPLVYIMCGMIIMEQLRDRRDKK